MNKKAEMGLDNAMNLAMIMILIVVILFIALMVFMTYDNQNESNCKKECEKLGLSFFKKDVQGGGLFSGTIINGYCIDNQNKLIDIGKC